MNRQRIDQLLVERGIFESRALARAAIEAGLVRADGAVVDKPSRAVPAEAQLEASRPFETVSRGGVKLIGALDAFAINPAGRIALDLGASTGGFTDALLRRGASGSMLWMWAMARCIPASWVMRAWSRSKGSMHAPSRMPKCRKW